MVGPKKKLKISRGTISRELCTESQFVRTFFFPQGVPMRWSITAEQRQQVIEAMMRLVEGDDHPIAIRAARLLIKMDEQNTKATEPTEEQRNRFHEIMRRIQREN